MSSNHSRLLMNQNKLNSFETSKRPNIFNHRYLCKEITQRPRVNFLISIAKWSAADLFTSEAIYLYRIAICGFNIALRDINNKQQYLKSGLVWISDGQKEVGLQMVWISNEIWNSWAWPFEIQPNACHFVKNNLKSRQKCPDFEWSIDAKQA